MSPSGAFRNGSTPKVLIVHGAFADGSIWAGVIPEGVDELLGGALAEEPACSAFGIQDVGTAPDAELRCFRPGKPDSVPDAELLVSGKMGPGPAAGCRGMRCRAGMR